MQKSAYEMRISDWSSDVCSSDLGLEPVVVRRLSRLVIGAADGGGDRELRGEVGVGAVGDRHRGVLDRHVLPERLRRLARSGEAKPFLLLQRRGADRAEADGKLARLRAHLD